MACPPSMVMSRPRPLAREGGAGPKEYYELAARYGITIQDDWIEELERTYGVKL